MFKKAIPALLALSALFASSLPSSAHASYLQFSGQLTMLRVHDVGTAYGPASDQIDAEVVIQLRGQNGKAFGFKLRNDNDKVARAAMLDLLRDAFENDWTVVINAELPAGKNNGILNRVWVTR